MFTSRRTYECNECKYKTCYKYNFEKHLSTISHNKNVVLKRNIGIDKIDKLREDLSLTNKKVKKLEETNKKLKEWKTKLKESNNKVNNLEKEISELKKLIKNSNLNIITSQIDSHDDDIMIVPYSDTDYTCLTKEDIMDAMSKDDYYLSYIFKKIHVDNPKNRNLFVRTKKAKEIFLYRGKENGWEPCNADDVLYGITMRCENACDYALEKNGLMYKYNEIINNYFNRRETDDDYKKSIYDKFRENLYIHKDKMMAKNI